MKKIEFFRRNVYGREMIYFVFNETTQAMQQLQGTITISKTQMALWEYLGFKFVEVVAPIKREDV